MLKKSLLLCALAVILTNRTHASSVLYAYYDKENQFVAVDVVYCFAPQESPMAQLVDGTCTEGPMPSCDVFLVVQGENPSPKEGDKCIFQWLYYSVSDLQKPLEIRFLGNDGSGGGLLIE